MYVWRSVNDTWLRAGVIDGTCFTYDEAYTGPSLAPELPLGSDPIRPKPGMAIAGVFAEAIPDAWGQQVIAASDVCVDDEQDTAALLGSVLACSDPRVGALRFTATDTLPAPMTAPATLERTLSAVRAVQAGGDGRLLLAACAVGGARPKAFVDDVVLGPAIAKFDRPQDPFAVVQAEYATMTLAAAAGVDVAPVRLTWVGASPVLLVGRFDRDRGRPRQTMSALTLLELEPIAGRWASYADLLAHPLWADHAGTGRELFARITFNVLTGNTDDHARNHAAFWDGMRLQLTPAYDICPQVRTGEEARQAIPYGPAGEQMSDLQMCVDVCATYGLSSAQARAIIDEQITVIEDQWDVVCDAAQLTAQQRSYLRGRQIMNPYALYRYR